MIDEKQKAYNNWLDIITQSPWLGKITHYDAFHAGWDAHATTTANSRTADRESAEQAGRQIERAALKRKFLALASTAFLAGQDEEAKLYRSIADLHFS